MADFSYCDFFRSNKGLTQNAHLSAWILGYRLSCCLLQEPLVFRREYRLKPGPTSGAYIHAIQRPSLLFSTHTPDTRPRSAQPLTLVAISLSDAAPHPVFLAVHNSRSARCGQTRIRSALSRLGIYVFSWSVYPLLIMLLADPRSRRASERVGHACPLGYGWAGFGSDMNGWIWNMWATGTV